MEEECCYYVIYVSKNGSENSSDMNTHTPCATVHVLLSY